MKFLPVIIAFLLCTGLRASTTKLSQAVDLPIVIEGKTVGSMKLPQGSEVDVVSNDGTNAVIRRGDSTYTIASSSLGTTTTVAAASPAVAPATATPTQTPFQASAPVDKTLIDSTLAPFFVAYGEHSPSIIDATRLGDEMPGSHGWLTVKNGHLYNGDKRQRLVGVNAGNVSEGEIAEMKKYGINAVKIGTRETIEDTWSKHPRKLIEGDTINPAGLRELDEKVGKFIKAGFWVDLLVNYSPGPAQVDDKERENCKKYLSYLLNHINPATGKTYGNDPAICSMEIANEFGARQRLVYPNDKFNSRKFNAVPFIKSIEAKWNKWLCEHYKTQAELEAAWPSTTDKLGSVIWNGDDTTRSFHIKGERDDWFKFTDDIEIDYTKDIMSFLHDQLHYQGLVIAGCGAIRPEITKLGDATMAHMYPDGNRETKTTRLDNKTGKDRLFGKPFFLTECHLDPLDSHYGEMGLGFLSAATAQDWDGVFFFMWDNNFHYFLHGIMPGPDNMIKGGNRDNSALLASLPTAINLFRRGDIAPLADKKHGDCQNYFEQQVGRWSPEINDQGLMEEKPFGDTGAYSLNDNTLNIVSPKTVLAIGSLSTNQLGDIHYQLGKTQLGWSCVGVTSLNNDLPIKDAKAILVTLIGKISNTGMNPLPGMIHREAVAALMDGETVEKTHFTKADYIKAYGTAPVVTECISANVFIPVDTSKGHFKAYSLNEKAQKKAEIPLEITAEGITLHTTGKEETIWYEIVRS